MHSIHATGTPDPCPARLNMAAHAIAAPAAQWTTMTERGRGAHACGGGAATRRGAPPTPPGGSGRPDYHLGSVDDHPRQVHCHITRTNATPQIRRRHGKPVLHIARSLFADLRRR